MRKEEKRLRECKYSLLRPLKQIDMTPSQFTFPCFHHSAERQRDVKIEKGLAFQLESFSKTIKATVTTEAFLKSVKLTL